MKKLMIALAVAAIAVCSQAAQIKWSGSNLYAGYDGKGAASDNKFTGTLYLFDSATVSQSALMTAFLGEGFDITKAGAINTYTMTSAGAIAASTPFEYGNTSTAYTMYFAALANDGEKDYLYLSNEKAFTTGGSATAPNSVAFGNQNATTSTTAPTYSSLAAMTDKSAHAGYWNAGSAAPTPEPTSGLLLVLGMAGLALRRRRA